MKELFEKIKERLEEEEGLAEADKARCLRKTPTEHAFAKGYATAMHNAIEIVNQVAEETNKGEISDGYHTFNELYHHRAILFSVICNSNKELAWKSRLHDTGDMYDGMFIVGIETPEGQATYHYDIEPYWDMFEVKKLQNAPKWDGHTPDEAIRRIGLLGKDINTSSNDGCIPLSKVAFDRMIARMESESERDIYEEESLFINVRDAARIVREIAREYKHGHFGCNFNGQHEKCKDCGLRGECSHYNTEWFAEYSNSEIPNMSDVPDKNVGEIDEVCEWKRDNDEFDIYDTKCKNRHVFFEGSPIDNEYEYCPYCGKEIKVVK